MPLIKNNKTPEEIDAALKEIEDGSSTSLKKEKESKAKAPKKEPKWSLIYFFLALIVFGLGLLTIALMNYWIYGTFSI